MEIADLVRAVRRRLWLLMILPLVAGGIAFARLANDPESYRASATVAVPSAIERQAGAVGQYVANFRETLRSDDVVSPVARETGVRARALERRLQATRVGTTTTIRVSFTGSNAAAVERVVVQAAEATVARLAAPALGASSAVVATAEERYEQARDDLEAFTAETGFVLPEDLYRTKQNQLAATRDEAAAEALRPELEALGEQVLRYQRLNDALQQATTVLNNARSRHLEADADVFQQVEVVQLVSDATLIRRGDLVARGVGTAVALALVLALGAILVLELLRPSARRGPDEADAIATATPAGPAVPLPGSHFDGPRGPAEESAPADDVPTAGDVASRAPTWSSDPPSYDG